MVSVLDDLTQSKAYKYIYIRIYHMLYDRISLSSTSTLRSIAQSQW